DLHRILDQMDPTDKAVIEFKYFEEKKIKEIAEILGENENTVKSRLYRGLRKLRIDLEAEGYDREA
ncbi:MAG: RNA polymerase sigma factor, partial [Candidatus Weimeria sp.]